MLRDRCQNIDVLYKIQTHTLNKGSPFHGEKTCMPGAVLSHVNLKSGAHFLQSLIIQTTNQEKLLPTPTSSATSSCQQPHSISTPCASWLTCRKLLLVNMADAAMLLRARAIPPNRGKMVTQPSDIYSSTQRAATCVGLEQQHATHGQCICIPASIYMEATWHQCSNSTWIITQSAAFTN